MPLWRYYNNPALRELAFLFPPLYGWRAKSFKEAIIAIKNRLDRPPTRIADVACGTGMFTKKLLLSFPDASIDAVDLSHRMTDMARKRLGYSRRVRVIKGDFMELDGRYDAVFALYLLMLTPLKTSIQHLLSLVPDGLLVFNLTAPTPATILHRKFYSIFTGETVTLYPPREALRIASSMGNVVDIKQIDPIEGSYLIVMRGDFE